MRTYLIAVVCLCLAACGGGGSGGDSNIGVQGTVPNVVGQPQAAATSAITGAGLTLGTVTMTSSAVVAAGNVISQTPASGASVAAGSAVNLVVSSGPPVQVQVPNVVGQSQAAATAAITGVGLRVGTVTMAASATVPTGNVISQNPASGTSIPINNTVDLVVSSGTNPPFGLTTRPPLANFTLPNQGGSGGAFSLVKPFPNLPNFDNPIFFAAVPAPDPRLIVVEQTGHVRAFANNAAVNTTKPILDVSSLIVCCGEQGLLGLAFDPNFTTKRYIYVDYTRAADGATVIARFTWDAGTDSASLASRKEILVIPQPYSNHNGGMVAFGPDGFLYIGMGDGGSGGDPQNHAQTLNGDLLGKILRIDVDPANDATKYLVPIDNPFVNTAGASKEIWSLGMRNPFRFSFDRQTGQLWTGDVGQGTWEEIDTINRGANYGWSRYEGNHDYNTAIPLAAGTQATFPVFEYDHSLGCAIIGGYVYRGSSMAALFGKYVYADYCSGTVWSIDTNGQNNTILTGATNPTSFGEDNNGELYVVTQGGGLFTLANSGGGGSQPTLLSQTGLFTNLANLTPASGLIEYDLNLPFWSDGAIKRRWVGIPQNAKVTFSPTSGWVFPIGTVIVKHFEMELTEGNPNSSRRLETRLLTRVANGDWQGFTYKWNANETDADLLVSGQSENLTVNPAGGGAPITWPYSYPSRTDCLQCHNTSATFALGLATRQLNRDFDYGAVTDNELRSLNHINYFTNPVDIGAPTQYDAYPALDDTNASVESRARAYLAVNCAQCHRPGGPTPVALDLRFDTANAAMGAIGVAPTEGTAGLPANALIITSGSKEASVLWQRMRNLDGTRMPKIASHRVDQEAVDLIGMWIDSL